MTAPFPASSFVDDDAGSTHRDALDPAVDEKPSDGIASTVEGHDSETSSLVDCDDETMPDDESRRPTEIDDPVVAPSTMDGPLDQRTTAPMEAEDDDVEKEERDEESGVTKAKQRKRDTTTTIKEGSGEDAWQGVTSGDGSGGRSAIPHPLELETTLEIKNTVLDSNVEATTTSLTSTHKSTSGELCEGERREQKNDGQPCEPQRLLGSSTLFDASAVGAVVSFSKSVDLQSDDTVTLMPAKNGGRDGEKRESAPVKNASNGNDNDEDDGVVDWEFTKTERSCPPSQQVRYRC